MGKSICVRIHEYCKSKERPVEGWNELMDYMISNRATFVDNDKPTVPVEDRRHG